MLDWTKYPHGPNSPTPGWVEESFTNFDKVGTSSLGTGTLWTMEIKDKSFMTILVCNSAWWEEQ